MEPNSKTKTKTETATETATATATNPPGSPKEIDFKLEIKQDIIRLKLVMKNIQQQLEILENHSIRNMSQNAEILNKSSEIIKQGNMMQAHITFIETVYAKIKKPFHWMMDKVNEMHDRYIEYKTDHVGPPLLELSGYEFYNELNLDESELKLANEKYFKQLSSQHNGGNGDDLKYEISSEI